MTARHRTILILLLGGVLALGQFAKQRVRLNWSDSAPRGIYVATREPIRRGSWVRLCPPGNVASLGLARGYLSRGSCPGGTTELLKAVAALPGDIVVVTDQYVSVDGRRLTATSRLSRDRAGRPVPRIPAGRYQVAPGHVWLVTERGRSWDSRYWGPVPVEAIRSTMRQLILGKMPQGG